MKVNLRKARVIEQQIRKVIAAEAKKLDTTEVAVSLNQDFETLEDEVTKARRIVLAALQRTERLEVIRTLLRASLGRSLMESGISDMRTEQATLKERIARLDRILENAQPTPDRTYLEREFEGKKARLATSDSWHYGSTLDVAVIDEATLASIRQMRHGLARKEQDIQDTLEKFTITNEIEIPDDDYQFMNEAGVVV